MYRTTLNPSPLTDLTKPSARGSLFIYPRIATTCPTRNFALLPFRFGVICGLRLFVAAVIYRVVNWAAFYFVEIASANIVLAAHFLVLRGVESTKRLASRVAQIVYAQLALLS
jgi:hypothetical protein